jgi:hypothetical protein
MGMQTTERVTIFTEDTGSFVNAPRKMVKPVVRLHS